MSIEIVRKRRGRKGKVKDYSKQDYVVSQLYNIMSVVALFILVAVNLNNMLMVVTLILFEVIAFGSVGVLKWWRPPELAAGIEWERNIGKDDIVWMFIGAVAIFGVSLSVSLVTSKIFGTHLSFESLKVLYLWYIPQVQYIPSTLSMGQLEAMGLGWWPANDLTLFSLWVFSPLEMPFRNFLYHFFIVAHAEESMKFAFQISLYDLLNERYGESVARWVGFGTPIILWANLHLMLSYVSGNIIGNWFSAVFAGIILFKLILFRKSLEVAKGSHGLFNWLQTLG